MTRPHLEIPGPSPTANEADQCRDRDNQRERQRHREDRDERRGCDAPENGVFSARDPMRWAAYRTMAVTAGDAMEQAGNDGHIAPGDIDPGQSDEDKQRRQDKQASRDDSAPSPMQQPSDIGCELLRLRPGQQHAVVEGMQESSFTDPASAFHQLGVHDGDLPCRAAKTDEPQLQPEPERLPEADRLGSLEHLVDGLASGRGSVLDLRVHALPSSSKLARSPSKTPLASARSWSSSAIVALRPARTCSTPAASGG